MKITGIIRTCIHTPDCNLNLEIERVTRYLSPEKHIYEVILPVPMSDEVLGLFMCTGAKFEVDDNNEVWINDHKVDFRVKEYTD